MTTGQVIIFVILFLVIIEGNKLVVKKVKDGKK
jgi:hypothetical protein